MKLRFSIFDGFILANFPSGTTAGPIPVNTALPAISGTPANDQTLTASTGTWDNSPTSYSYQWLRGDTPTEIPGATGDTYAIDPDNDDNKPIRVRVIATNENGDSEPAISDPTTNVNLPVNTVQPTLSGANLSSPAYNDILSCSTGTWINASSLAYQWIAYDDPDGITQDTLSNSSGTANTANYQLDGSSSPDAFRYFRCLVTATGPSGLIVDAVSDNITGQVNFP